ncbi:MAG: hypothetical protein IJT49_10465 [Clostridia bacterium]|nr:hypothetical protein [Clostridia bacterium]
MKTYEWIIKIISYILCCAAVCAGFSIKEKAARETLDSYIRSEEDRRTSELCGILSGLKESLCRSISDEADKASLSDVAYYCKAAADAVCVSDGGKSSEALRGFFARVRKTCGNAYENGGKITPVQRRQLSELYMRLLAVEDVLLSGKMSVSELISALSSGITTPKGEEKSEKFDRISMSSAEKRAYELVGDGVRLRNCGIYDGNFIFASSGSCMILTNKGKPYIKSRTVTDGSEHIDPETAENKAKEYIFDITGMPCEARLEDKVFGIYYFTVISDGKEYPVGIDKTDGKVVFEVIAAR